MSKWTHALCDPCYHTIRPHRVPVRIKQGPHPTCCQCGQPTTGIYYRANPETWDCDHTTWPDEDE